MQTKCPACGAVSSLDVLIANDEASAAIAMALELHPLGKTLIRYIALFRPQKNSLSFGRVTTLLNELIPMIRAGEIERNGITWPAPMPYWQAALDQVVASSTLTLPLKSHGYLLSVIAGIGDKAAHQVEKAAEVAARNRSPPPPPRAAQAPAATPPPRDRHLTETDRASARQQIAQITDTLRLKP